MAITVSILVGFLAALVAPFLHALAPRVSRVVFVAVPLGLCTLFATLIPEVSAGANLVVSTPWVPALGLSLAWHVDGLGLLFALIITGVGTLVTLYAGSYLGERHPFAGRFHLFLFLFMTSMLGLVLIDDVIVLFVFWELTSLSSYFLIGFEHDKPAARNAALRALLVTAVGGLALLAGMILLSQATGTNRLSEMPRDGAVGAHLHYVPIVILTLTAAFTKSAQFPFHFWLPRAMEAPTPVSAYLHAATMVKAGVYLLARLSPVLAGPGLWQDALTGIGATTAVLGAVMALREQHFKRVLAYSTIGALGVMVLLIGLGTAAAFQAMVVFLLAHAAYKGALFLVAGAVSHATHQSDLEALGRLRLAMPLTAAAAGLAALSMGGVPPFLGFIGKERLFEATLVLAQPAWLAGWAMLVEALFLAVALLAGLRIFWGSGRPAPEPSPPVREVNFAMWFPPLLLAGLGLSLGIWPAPIQGLLARAAAAASNDGFGAVDLSLWHGFGPALYLSAGALALGVLLYFGRFRLRRLAGALAGLTRYGPDRTYDRTLDALGALARQQTRLLQSGYLRSYILVVLMVTVGLVGYPLLHRLGVARLGRLDEVRFYEACFAGLVLLAALSAVRARSRFPSVISLGVVGYGVALIFVLYGAPDLAMTQIVVETLTVIILLLAFYRLPRFAHLSSTRARSRDVVVAVAFGALMTGLVLAASATPVDDAVSTYFGETSVELAHGRNVVNVILTDYRALDTLGEIAVLATAAFGVVALLRFRTNEAGSP